LSARAIRERRQAPPCLPTGERPSKNAGAEAGVERQGRRREGLRPKQNAGAKAGVVR